MGTTVTAVLAGDADVRGGDSWQVDYRLESGNEEEAFTLVTDKQTNEVSLVLSKVNNKYIPQPLCTHFNTFLSRFKWENCFCLSCFVYEKAKTVFSARSTNIDVKDSFWHDSVYLLLLPLQPYKINKQFSSHLEIAVTCISSRFMRT